MHPDRFDQGDEKNFPRHHKRGQEEEMRYNGNKYYNVLWQEGWET